MYDFKKKTQNIQQNNDYLLTKTLSMFEWENLPETIPSKQLEKILQQNGFAFITEVKGELYAFRGSLGGELDEYENPTKITINNIALNFNKTLDVRTDGVLISSDDMKMGLLPLFNKYNFMLVENDINMVLHGYNSRLQTFISASDDKTRASAEAFMKKLVDGDLSVIGENALFDGVKTHSGASGQSNSITALTEFHQYLKGSLFNEIGLNANFNMKRERLISGEVEAVEDSLYPFIDNMMKNRQLAIEKINEKYQTSILIGYGSVWHKKNKELVNDIVETKTEETEQWNETQETTALESLDESLLESLDESLNESETSEPEAGEPEPVAPEAVEPEASEPETVEPEAGEPKISELVEDKLLDLTIEEIEFILEDSEVVGEYRELLENKLLALKGK